jgi:hypothetical protein
LLICGIKNNNSYKAIVIVSHEHEDLMQVAKKSFSMGFAFMGHLEWVTGSL